MSAREYAAKRLHEFANPVSAVVVDAEDVIDAIMKAIKEEIIPKDQTYQEFFGLDEKPQLIQGYTAEQWKEIIGGGYLCVIGDISMGHIRQIVSMEKDGNGDWKFKATSGFETFLCRPAQLKGVMRPIFVEPVDDSVMCCFFSGSGFPLHNMRSRCSWGHYKTSGNEFSDATKYIEL